MTTKPYVDTRITLNTKESEGLRKLAELRGVDLETVMDEMLAQATESWNQGTERVKRYTYLASNPYRRDEDDVHLASELEALKALGRDPNVVPVQRRPPPVRPSF